MNWSDIIKSEQKKPYYKDLVLKLNNELETHTVYPKHEDIFNAFKVCSYNKTKVLILGMDPYHNYGEAHGLSFSVLPRTKVPPSLQNIFKELKSDLDILPPNHGCLTSWAKQGVLLLNAALTVRQNEPGSHQKLGWHTFTDNIISILNKKDSPVVFILWGNFARKKKQLITEDRHLILESPHPSPFSAYSGFFGSKPFSKANDFLIKLNIDPINWHINNL
jgi:uracil-DNA glycosylase